MPASVHDIQRMLTVCDNVGIQLDMLFNAKRSFLFKIGKIFKVDLEQLQIGNSNVQWSNRLKCLGINFCSGERLAVNASATIRKLYASANAVFLVILMFLILLN